jgi:hypothetical protein
MAAMHSMGTTPIHKSLTDEQKNTVKDILSNYDTANLTAADAKNIFKSLKEAGIRGGGVREAISETGIDADQLWSLAHDGQKPPQGPPPMGGPGGQGGGSAKIDAAALESLQSILNQFDLSNLSDDQEKDLFSQLSKTGLLKSGSVLDTAA